MRVALFFAVILIVFSGGHSSKAMNLPDNVQDGCPVKLEVTRVFGAPVLGHGYYDETGVNYSLTVVELNRGHQQCQGYLEATEMQMNSVESALPDIKDLKPGDLILGSVNHHLPSPYGKTLFEEYHNGLKIFKVKVSDTVRDYTNAPLYFRHIAVY